MTEKTYLPQKRSHYIVTSSLNIFNAESLDICLKHGYYEQFYPQEPLFENIYFQIYSNDYYFIDLSATFIDLKVVARKRSNNEIATASDGLSLETEAFTICLDKYVFI